VKRGRKDSLGGETKESEVAFLGRMCSTRFHGTPEKKASLYDTLVAKE
jgi:hypothetical protein